MRKRRWIVAGIVVTGALLTPIIGPFTFYADVVPVLGPILPRPDGVPRHADAAYSFKGFGMDWRWEQRFDGGCARWFAADFMDEPYRSVTLFDGKNGCVEDRKIVSRTMSQDFNVLSGQHELSGEEPCPFTVDESALARYARKAADLRLVTVGAIERQMLLDVETRLSQTDGNGLITYVGGGCRDTVDDVPAAAIN